jgi:TRAP-type mannitol/chloroaromatic compound transport system permease large subunit
VAFALPGAAIVTILLAAGFGYLFTGDTRPSFLRAGPSQWLSAGVTNFRGIYWEAERDTLIAIPLFVFMGIMLQRSKIAEDLLVTMAQLFGPDPGRPGHFRGLRGRASGRDHRHRRRHRGGDGPDLAACDDAQQLLQPALATGTIAASGTLGQIIPPSIVLIILADQLASSATDQAGRRARSFTRKSPAS